MPTVITRSKDGNSVLVVHEPGNMTRYVGTGHKIEDGPAGYADLWVVSFPETGSSALFREGQPAHWSYVAEKLGRCRTGRNLPLVDVSEMTKVVALIIPGSHATTVTDNTGHLTAENCNLMNDR